MPELSFNSLQTGKPIQSLRVCKQRWQRKRSVSIPFKRESLSKVTDTPALSPWKRRFNSLQTGKPIQRESIIEFCFTFIKCFNSLQTGKPIQRLLWHTLTIHIFGFNSLQTGKPIQRETIGPIHVGIVEKVSIPFKRESLSKDGWKVAVIERIAFQFPSNGKAYPKKSQTREILFIFHVSIPFKRESLSKARPTEL